MPTAIAHRESRVGVRNPPAIQNGRTQTCQRDAQEVAIVAAVVARSAHSMNTSRATCMHVSEREHQPAILERIGIAADITRPASISANSRHGPWAVRDRSSW